MTVNITAFEKASGHQSPRCGIAKALAGCTPRQAAQLKAALAADTVSAQGIVTVLDQWGIKSTRRVVDQHRRKDCSCGK